MDLQEIYRKWFDYHIAGKKNEVEQWPQVRLFVMNGNRWIEADDWPVPGTEYINYYLREGNKLDKAKPIIDELPDTYTYDPENPAPLIWSYSVDSGCPDNYEKVDKRSDILVYETNVSDNTFTVCGPITATLYAATSATDTDWVARISLVHPSGYVQRLTEGWTRARSRNGFFKNELVKPGTVEKYKIDLWGTAVEIVGATAGNRGTAVVYDSNAQRVLIAYTKADTYAYVRVGEISGTSVTLGTEVAAASLNSYYPELSYDVADQKVLFVFNSF